MQTDHRLEVELGLPGLLSSSRSQLWKSKEISGIASPYERCAEIRQARRVLSRYQPYSWIDVRLALVDKIHPTDLC
jgi:hypothetical protein